MFVGWNFPQPAYAKRLQDFIVGKIKGTFGKKDDTNPPSPPANTDQVFLMSSKIILNTEPDEIPDEIPREKIFGYYEEIVSTKVHNFYISRPIEEPCQYTDMVHRIRTALPQEIIKIYINCPGGVLMSGIQIINAMQSTQAQVITFAEGEVGSLASLIFLQGHAFSVANGSYMMIHNHSGGSFGKGHEYLAQANFTTKWFSEFSKEIYTGFLSDDEFNRMIKGEDFYFTTKQIVKRLKKYAKLKEREQEK